MLSLRLRRVFHFESLHLYTPILPAIPWIGYLVAHLSINAMYDPTRHTALLSASLPTSSSSFHFYFWLLSAVHLCSPAPVWEREVCRSSMTSYRSYLG